VKIETKYRAANSKKGNNDSISLLTLKLRTKAFNKNGNLVTIVY
jgi:hypothetical protein